jgi:hypothetical protein
MRVERKLGLGLLAGLAAINAAGAPAFASLLPVPCIKQCYVTQSSTGGFTLEYCRRFVPWRFYDESRRRRLGSNICR